MAVRVEMTLVKSLPYRTLEDRTLILTLTALHLTMEGEFNIRIHHTFRVHPWLSTNSCADSTVRDLGRALRYTSSGSGLLGTYLVAGK